MTRRFAYLIAATLALAAAPPAVMSASPAPRPVEAVDILVDGVAQPRFAHGGRWYVEARKGREYAIRLRNPYPRSRRPWRCRSMGSTRSMRARRPRPPPANG